MRKTKAIVHIARKLLNRIRFVLKNQAEICSGCCVIIKEQGCRETI